MPPAALVLLPPHLQVHHVGLRAYELALEKAGVHNVPPHVGADAGTLLAALATAAGAASHRAVCVLGARAGQDAVLYAEAYAGAVVTLVEPAMPLRPVDAGLQGLAALFRGRVTVADEGSQAAAAALAACGVVHVNLDGADLAEHYRLWTTRTPEPEAVGGGRAPQVGTPMGSEWLERALREWQASAAAAHSGAVLVLHGRDAEVEAFSPFAVQLLTDFGAQASVAHDAVSPTTGLRLVVASVPGHGAPLP